MGNTKKAVPIKRELLRDLIKKKASMSKACEVAGYSDSGTFRAVIRKGEMPIDRLYTLTKWLDVPLQGVIDIEKAHYSSDRPEDRFILDYIVRDFDERTEGIQGDFQLDNGLGGYIPTESDLKEENRRSLFQYFINHSEFSNPNRPEQFIEGVLSLVDTEILFQDTSRFISEWLLKEGYFDRKESI